MNHLTHAAISILIFTFFSMHIISDTRHIPIESLDYTLAYLDFEEMFNLENGRPTACSDLYLKKYADYFKRVTDLKPDMGDAWGALAFCYFHLGKEKQAMTALQKAISYCPLFGSFYYNTGVIYFGQGKLSEAQIYFQKALNTPFEANLMYIKLSKIYADIMRHSKHSNMDIQQRVKEMYELSYAAYTLCVNLQQNPSSRPSNLHLSPQLF